MGLSAGEVLGWDGETPDSGSDSSGEPRLH